MKNKVPELGPMIFDESRRMIRRFRRRNNIQRNSSVSYLKYKYGLTPEQLEKMRLNQNFSCAICLRQLPLVVDHNHANGKVRALLCVACNVGLGQFQDSVVMLERAQEYIHKHQ